MKRTRLFIFVAMAASLAMLISACMKKEPMAQSGENLMDRPVGMRSMTPFGSLEDVAYAEILWTALTQARLAGPSAVTSIPYEGMSPHGSILEMIAGKVRVGSHTGMAYVKANHGGPGLTRSMVANDRKSHLKAVTVMYQREKGYDTANQDWFWVKYTADGKLHKNPQGTPLAGRVAKGSDKGCIACHLDADGHDYLFNNDSSQLDE